MRTGRMNTPFLVQSCRLVADGQGGHVAEWSTIASLWGAIEDIYERRVSVAQDDSTHIVTTRPRDDLDLTNELRMTSGERVYTIRQARIVGRGKGRMKLFVHETQYLN
ncbi:MAG: head-tail adaptor protein [Alphaproteobacteria bacterium]|nr:head-tail adaptor protein [Alphaproteobacteria bacterium]